MSLKKSINLTCDVPKSLLFKVNSVGNPAIWFIKSVWLVKFCGISKIVFLYSFRKSVDKFIFYFFVQNHPWPPSFPGYSIKSFLCQNAARFVLLYLETYLRGCRIQSNTERSLINFYKRILSALFIGFLLAERRFEILWICAWKFSIRILAAFADSCHFQTMFFLAARLKLWEETGGQPRV